MVDVIKIVIGIFVICWGVLLINIPFAINDINKNLIEIKELLKLNNK